MHLHHARRDARTDAGGGPILIEDLEAAIAAEHAFAPSFAETRWPLIVQLYDRLQQMDPSPLHSLHAAIALSYADGPEPALARLEIMRPPTWLSASHLWLATCADLRRRLGNVDEARTLYERAIALAPPFERRVLERRLRGGGDR